HRLVPLRTLRHEQIDVERLIREIPDLPDCRPRLLRRHITRPERTENPRIQARRDKLRRGRTGHRRLDDRIVHLECFPPVCFHLIVSFGCPLQPSVLHPFPFSVWPLISFLHAPSPSRADRKCSGQGGAAMAERESSSTSCSR